MPAAGMVLVATRPHSQCLNGPGLRKSTTGNDIRVLAEGIAAALGEPRKAAGLNVRFGFRSGA